MTQSSQETADISQARGFEIEGGGSSEYPLHILSELTSLVKHCQASLLVHRDSLTGAFGCRASIFCLRYWVDGIRVREFAKVVAPHLPF